MRSPTAQVETVLRDMRSALRNRSFCFVPRKKNMDTLAALGLLMSDVMDALTSLTVSDYVKGPETDRDFPETDGLWIFQKRIYEQPIYIKFKVETQRDGGVKVVSFHIDEFA